MPRKPGTSIKITEIISTTFNGQGLSFQIDSDGRQVDATIKIKRINPYQLNIFVRIGTRTIPIGTITNPRSKYISLEYSNESAAPGIILIVDGDQISEGAIGCNVSLTGDTLFLFTRKGNTVTSVRIDRVP